MQDLIKEINKRLDILDFDRLWKGFVRYDFALYDKQNVYFNNYEVIPVDNRFLGNTSIEYNGKYIAIWNIGIEDIKSLDILTSSLVHEMYHAHQFTLNEKRFVSDMEGLKYPYDLENFILRYKERLLLTSAIRETEVGKKTYLLNQFASIRRNREKIINDSINYEKAIETVEGCAEYVSLKALKTLSFKDFTDKINYICDNLCRMDVSIFETRKISYYTGAILCILCEDTGKDFFDVIGESRDYLFDRVFCNEAGSTRDVQLDFGLDYSKIEQLYSEYIENIRYSIDVVVLNDLAKRIKGSFKICGYDPMNMVRYENMVLHRNFVIVNDENGNIFFKGPAITVSNTDNLRECDELIYVSG